MALESYALVSTLARALQVRNWELDSEMVVHEEGAVIVPLAQGIAEEGEEDGRLGSGK